MVPLFSGVFHAENHPHISAVRPALDRGEQASPSQNHTLYGRTVFCCNEIAERIQRLADLKGVLKKVATGSNEALVVRYQSVGVARGCNRSVRGQAVATAKRCSNPIVYRAAKRLRLGACGCSRPLPVVLAGVDGTASEKRERESLHESRWKTGD